MVEATQDLSAVIPQLLAQGLMALRENAIMPQLVNRELESMAGQQGSTIDVPVPAAITGGDVTAAATPPETDGTVPTSVPIVLDRWKEAAFHLTDKDRLEIQNGFMPKMASEAIKWLGNEVDQYLLSLGSKFYGYVGTAGTTPFANSTADATQARKVLNQQLAPLDPRYFVFDPEAEANALELRAFQDTSFSGSPEAIRDGKINKKLGFTFAMDQNVQTHTAGTGTGYLVNNDPGPYAVGTKTVVTDTGSGTVLAGDIITFSGHSQTYVVVSSVGGGSVTSITFEPGLVATVANNETITLKATHVMNLAFQPNAIAFATRPLERSRHPASIVDTQIDPVSGLALRLEVTREHRRDRFAFDILYGAEVVRRELGCRVAG